MRDKNERESSVFVLRFDQYGIGTKDEKFEHFEATIRDNIENRIDNDLFTLTFLNDILITSTGDLVTIGIAEKQTKSNSNSKIANIFKAEKVVSDEKEKSA